MKLIYSFLPILLLAIFVQCDTPRQVKNEEPVLIRLNILLKDGINAEKLEQVFRDYELKKEKVLSFAENRWVYTFNSQLITLDDILNKLRSNAAVLEAKANE